MPKNNQRSRARLPCLLVLGLAYCASPRVAYAQGDEDAGAADAPSLVAPTLLSTVRPSYPAGETQPASVVLELSVDTNGRVSQASVSQSAGERFDAAALAWAYALRFSPALRDGVAIAAIIPFRVDLAPDPTRETTENAAPVVAPASDEVPLLGSVELDVRGPPPVREVTRRSLDAHEVRTLPGTNGDVLRSVEALPGVARPSPFDGILVVRGSAPNDSQVFVDGTAIPLAYHFGGISSVIPGDLLDRLDFYPGNFGPQFGRGMGGVIDVGLRSPRRDRFGALLQLDAIDGRLLLETPLAEHTRLLIAARRSWVDAWLGPALDGADVSVRSAPVYWDGQLVLEQDLGSKTRARLALVGSDDRFALLIKTPSARDPALGGGLSSATGFLRAQLRVDSQLSAASHLGSMLSWGYTDSDARLGGGFFNYGLHEINARSELRTLLNSWLTWTAGFDVAYSRYDVDLNLAPYPGDNAAPGPYFARPTRRIQAIAPLLRPALYTGVELSPVAALKIMPSLRLDYADDTQRLTLDPRLSTRWDVVPAPRRTTLKAGFGLYQQPPQPQESVKAVGTPGVRSNAALHASLGVEQVLAPDLELSVEGFYKRLSSLVVARADEARLIGARFDNTGQGRVFGAEVLLRYRPAEGRVSGWLAYTLSRSERRDEPRADYYTFAYDQTHILSVVASVKLGAGWTAGGRFRYVTGNPYSAYLGGVVDLDAGAYAALAPNVPNTARLGAFHQLDLRIEKLWAFEAWKLTAYLELRNAYNRANPESVTYNYDYSRSKPVAGLPILPVLGVRGEL